MKIFFHVQWNKIEDIIDEIRKIEGVEEVTSIEKTPVSQSFLDRKPNYQIEIYEVIINIALSILSEEAYKIVKERISEYLKKKKELEKIQIEEPNDNVNDSKEKQ
ncbi:MAG: hypothetical protein JNL70_26635 [Saprospiraceae bacterium]|nr:hypothetical protein [Saprospiraceae bacterium]